MSQPLQAGVPAFSKELLDPATESVRPLLRPGQLTVVTFLRGTWCPNCRAFLDQLRPFHPQIQQRGAELVGVVCQGRHWVKSWLAVNPLEFPLLVDEDRAVAQAYGVYKLLGLDGVNIAKPATFIIGRDGKIGWSYVGENQKDRPTTSALLEALDRLSGTTPPHR